jgi:hypothetical protein
MLQRLINKRILITLVALALCVWLVRFCSKNKNTEFPKIKTGNYGGEIIIKKVSYPILISNSETLTTLAIVNSGLSPKKIDLKQLKIELEGKTYDLVGQKINRQYQGEVLLNQKNVGSWTLEKIKTLPLAEPKNTELLELIKNYYTLRAEAKALREDQIDLKARIDNYKNAIPREEKIRATAVNEIDDLKYSLEEKQNLKKQLLKEIKNKVTDLEQLQRITTQGRVVDLARRTTKREDRWYLANWGEEGFDESQQQVADSLGVDLAKLDEKLKLAEEYLSLKNSIGVEARRIEEIRNAKIKPTEPIKQEDTRPIETPRRKDESIWNKIGGVFGL